MKRRGLKVLGGMSAERFLADYWQKKPTVIRGAFAGLQDPLSVDELAGLACTEGVDSRLIVQAGAQWRVTRGPQREKTLRQLPRSHWTLLVESMDRHSAEVAALASPFSFLPKWRMDDVMVSLAPLHGTVDAHIDSYDVFLIQGQGRRRWEIDSRAKPDYKPGLDLRILKKFRAQESWILDPGDMLYVPPGCGHRGTTVASDEDIALTYSVGFRAPSDADVLSSVLARIVARDSPMLFSDADRKPTEDATELSASDLAMLKTFLLKTTGTMTADQWTLTAGEAVTQGGQGSARPSRETVKGFAAKLRAGRSLRPSTAARMSWARLTKDQTALFVNGESRVLRRAEAFAAAALCGPTSPADSRRISQRPSLIQLSFDLLRAGVIEWDA